MHKIRSADVSKISLLTKQEHEELLKGCFPQQVVKQAREFLLEFERTAVMLEPSWSNYSNLNPGDRAFFAANFLEAGMKAIRAAANQILPDEHSGLQAGDIVRLKSGGPLMLVDRLGVNEYSFAPTVRCLWAGDKEGWLEPAALEVVVRAEDTTIV